MSWKSKEEQRRVASMGGKAAQAKATAHRFKAGSEAARAAGLKGGLAYKAKMEARRLARKAQGTIDAEFEEDSGTAAG